MTNQFTRMTDDEWFVNGTRRNNQNSKKRMIQAGIPDKCSEADCPNPNPEWRGRRLTLQIDHIDGDRWNNNVSNLRILCPNCHTQTETYSNNGSRRARFYCECGVEIWKGSKRCRDCDAAERKGVTFKEWPDDPEEIIQQVRLTGWSATGRLYGASDNGVRKHLESLGINIRNIKRNMV